MHNLNWKKGLFSSTYEIYSNDRRTGELIDKAFSQSSTGRLNGKEYLFKTKGFLKQHTDIIDVFEGRIIGKIVYNEWMNKATISLKDKTIHWKYDNVWNSKWSLLSVEGVDIKYAGSSTKGLINSNTDDPLLLLSGLFVTNYYWQMTIALVVAVFVPLWTTLSN